jgi:hypothetical protein
MSRKHQQVIAAPDIRLKILTKSLVRIKVMKDLILTRSTELCTQIGGAKTKTKAITATVVVKTKLLSVLNLLT